MRQLTIDGEVLGDPRITVEFLNGNPSGPDPLVGARARAARFTGIELTESQLKAIEQSGAKTRLNPNLHPEAITGTPCSILIREDSVVESFTGHLGRAQVIYLKDVAFRIDPLTSEISSCYPSAVAAIKYCVRTRHVSPRRSPNSR